MVKSNEYRQMVPGIRTPRVSFAGDIHMIMNIRQKSSKKETGGGKVAEKFSAIERYTMRQQPGTCSVSQSTTSKSKIEAPGPYRKFEIR